MKSEQINIDAFKLAKQLVDTLPEGLPNLFNPWKDICKEDEPWNTPEEKLKRLAAHLDCNPAYILCGEAPGFQGCRHSGIAFTSEKQLVAGSIPRVPKIDKATFINRPPYTEPSATIVWRTLHQHGIAERTLLWNAVQLHPHKPNNHKSNRTPTHEEIALGVPALLLLSEFFPGAKFVAIGNQAESLLKKIPITTEKKVRHPSFGGAKEFAIGISDLLK